MRALKMLPAAWASGAISLPAAPEQQPTLADVVDKSVAQERAEAESLRQYVYVCPVYIAVDATTGEATDKANVKFACKKL